MSPLPRLCLVLALSGLLAGCQLALPGGDAAGDEAVTPNAVAGDAIEVTSLDAPAPAAAPAGASETTAQPQADAPQPVAAQAEPAPAPQPDAPVEEPLPEAVEAVPEPPKSPEQLACEDRRGRWVPVGSGTLRTCVFETRDGGKQCSRESDCEGVCLARSGTCSPLRPLLGCHEILQDNGARVTLCIE